MEKSTFRYARARMGGAAVATALIASMFSVGNADAIGLTIVNGSPVTLGSNFDPAGWNNPDGVGQGTIIQTFDSAHAAGGLEANALGPVSLTFTYLGFEAAFTNVSQSAFSFGNTNMFVNQTTAVGNQVTATFNLTNPGFIPFLFASTAYSPAAVAANGHAIDPNVAIGFAIDPLHSNVAFAFFEDIHVNGDNDFDDMVVRIQIDAPANGNDPSPTPLPASLPLFASGLGMLGYLARRRRQKANLLG